MRAPWLCQKSTSNRGGRPETGRKAVFSLVVGSLLILVGPTTPAVANVAQPTAAPDSANLNAAAQTNWEDILYWYLFWLYQHLGGDPNNLNPLPPPVQCMDAVAQYYWKFGMKSGLSEGELATFREMIVGTSLHLDSAPATIDPAATTSFRQALESMYADVGGDPDTLY